MKKSLVLLTVAISLLAQSASATCVNKFLSRSEGSRQVVTLLTGMMTFQEAQTLAAAIESRKAEPVMWVDNNGKEIKRQFGPLKVVRPMPVGCDGRTSGVVLIISFPTNTQPSKVLDLKFDDKTTVHFLQSE